MKQHSPAAARNAQPIAYVLAEELPASGTVLEIASGTGEHAVYFAQKFPALQWQPSDADDAALASIRALRAESGLANLREPLKLDAAGQHWPFENADAVFCCNMVHISPVAATEGLLRGAARVLGREAPLIFYGPFFESGVDTAPSNLAFDTDLRRRNPEWGIRHSEWLDSKAATAGFIRHRRVIMPANNLMLAYRQK